MRSFTVEVPSAEQAASIAEKLAELLDCPSHIALLPDSKQVTYTLGGVYAHARPYRYSGTDVLTLEEFKQLLEEFYEFDGDTL